MISWKSFRTTEWCNISGSFSDLCRNSFSGKSEKQVFPRHARKATAKSCEKLLRATEKDKRAVAVKPADRLRNMRAISFCSEEKRLIKSKETADFYIPLAHRYGFREIEEELTAICRKQA